MNTIEPSQHEKIILAAIECIEREGIQSVTIRSIARTAGVNIAAINYYFGSKQNLLEMVLQSTVDHVFTDWEEMLSAGRMGLRSRLIEIFTYTIEGMIRYPNLSKAHSWDTLVNGNYDTTFVLLLNAFLGSVFQKVKVAMDDATNRRLKFSLAQIMSAVILAGMAPGLLSEFTGIDLTDARARKAYVAHMVDRCLGLELCKRQPPTPRK